MDNPSKNYNNHFNNILSMIYRVMDWLTTDRNRFNSIKHEEKIVLDTLLY